VPPASARRRDWAGLARAGVRCGVAAAGAAGPGSASFAWPAESVPPGWAAALEVHRGGRSFGPGRPMRAARRVSDPGLSW